MPFFLSLGILLLLNLNLSATDPDLTVAFAEVDVSPSIDKNHRVYMAGFGHNRLAQSLHDPIMTRVVLLSDGTRKIALVCVDVVGLFLPFVDEIRNDLSGFDYVLVSSTHNHEGPDTLGLWGASPFQSGVDPAYMKAMREKIVATVLKAETKMQSAKVRIGRKNLPHLLHDNRLPIVKQDDLTILDFRSSKEGQRIGLLVNWHCHPETLDSKNSEMSSDFVGYTVSELNKVHHCPIAYFTGAVGGLMTSLDVPLKNARGEMLKDGTFEKTEAYGKAIADEATAILKNTETLTLTPFAIRTRRFLTPVENPIYKAGWQLGVLKRPIFLWNNDPLEQNPKAAVDAKLPLAIQSEVGCLHLGELEIAVIPGEIYPELVQGKIQDPVDPGADFPEAPKEISIREASQGKHRMLIGLGNDEIGYIIPKRQWDEKEPFCYGLKKSQYGEINSLGPNTAPILMNIYSGLASGK